jgi:3-isopropylmalate dehydrogenase
MADTIVVIPGDCIGPEVMREALRVVDMVAGDCDVHEASLGAAALREHGTPLPPETLAACLESTAILKAPVGDPEFDNAPVRPEVGIFELRQLLRVYCNVRPSRLGDIDFVIVRELLGGLYYGARGTRPDGTVFDTCEYHPSEVERIVRAAAKIARSRRGQLTSVDKSNVLATSKMWRATAQRVAGEFPDVAVDHLLVDNVAMQLVQRPQRFDVIVTENMFGDILSDLAAALTGGLGMAGSASLADDGPGLFEPVHGSAPDIAGRGVANPVGMLRATAMMLRFGLGREESADLVERAIDDAMQRVRTPDIGGTATTEQVGDAVLRSLEKELTRSGI